MRSIPLILLAVFTASISASSQDNTAPTPLEQRLKIYYQTYLNQNRQAVYKRYHPWGGTATAVTVTSAIITQWHNEVDSEQPIDIVQFTIDFTLLWSSPFHPNGTGHTQARTTYEVKNGTVLVVGRQIINSNGKYTVNNEGQTIMSAAKFLMLLK